MSHSHSDFIIHSTVVSSANIQWNDLNLIIQINVSESFGIERYSLVIIGEVGEMSDLLTAFTMSYNHFDIPNLFVLCCIAI